MKRFADYHRVLANSPLTKMIVLMVAFQVITFYIGFDVMRGALNEIKTNIGIAVSFFVSLGAVVFIMFWVIWYIVYKFYNDSVLYTLITVYITISIIFSGLYYLLQSAFVINDEVTNPLLLSTEFLNAQVENFDAWMLAGILYADMIYFGFVTITTLGYGDISPQTWYAKILVVLHVAAGLYLLAISANRHFVNTANRD